MAPSSARLPWFLSTHLPWRSRGVWAGGTGPPALLRAGSSIPGRHEWRRVPHGVFLPVSTYSASLLLSSAPDAHCIRAWGARGEGPSPSEALGEGLNSAWEAAQHSLRYGPDPLEQSDLHFIASPLQ